MDKQLTDRAKAFRTAITAFINARREAKLKGELGDGDASSKYEYGTWLADAARRVSQIQAVTHTLKATHPDARGSSLHVVPADLPQHSEIGTHSLGDIFSEDVVGNAAALDVFKFLKVEVDGRRLLDWMQTDDVDLRSALHTDVAIASAWMGAFRHLVHSDAQPASHEAAKQLYWLTGETPADDSQYRLLQPLFSSSLAHAVHEELQDARFGEVNKLARQAFREKAPHDVPYRNYSNLAARKLGGTKPQNISQLNSERGGVNYLLASSPPRWRQSEARQPKHTADVWTQFEYFGEVRGLLKALVSLLKPTNKPEPKPVMETRQAREAIEQALGVQMVMFSAAIHACFEPGWSRVADCELHQSEKLWLDPERAGLPLREGFEAEDADFNAAYARNDWPDAVAGRFAQWLNGKLRDAGMVAVGDSEAKHWAKQALVEAEWPVAVQRRIPAGGLA